MRNKDTSAATQARLRQVVMLLANGDAKYYRSVKQAADSTGLWHSGIINCCRGNLKTTGGRVFRYLSDFVKQQMETNENRQS